MKSGMIYILVFLLLLPSAAWAEEFPYDLQKKTPAEDSLCCGPFSLYFRLGRSLLEYDYMENASTFSEFHTLFTDSLSAACVDTVVIMAYASPEGDETYNGHLAVKRAEAVKGYLVWKYPFLNQNRIVTHPRGEDWIGLRRLIQADARVPDREEVLAILDKVSDTDRCKLLLRQLNCGYAYRYIYRNILPRLRNAMLCTVRLKQPKYTDVLDARPSLGEQSIAEHREQRFFTSSEARESVTERLMQSAMKYSVQSDGKPSSFRFNPSFAIKSNLLFDFALAPNIELEFPLGRNDRWSFNVEWVFPWWLIDDDKYCFQVLYGGLEGRYWLGDRAKHRTLNGHFLGFYAGAGEYDLQWKRDGYQGEFYIAAGISYGYALPLARRLNLEFSVGIGLLRTDYEHYHAVNGYETLLWQSDGKYTWFGPTKAKISLVWLLGKKWRKGGER